MGDQKLDHPHPQGISLYRRAGVSVEAGEQQFLPTSEPQMT